jgi:putative transposase
MRRHRRAKVGTTDGLRSYPAAMKARGNAVKREIGRWASNGCESSHLPFRRREGAMLRFRQMKSLQESSAVHAACRNHFNQQRHLISWETHQAQGSAAQAEWQSLVA